jgi:hypothetical protein
VIVLTLSGPVYAVVVRLPNISTLAICRSDPSYTNVATLL